MGSGEAALQEGFPPQATAIARWVKTYQSDYFTKVSSPTPYSLFPIAPNPHCVGAPSSPS